MSIRFNAAKPLDPKKYPESLQEGREEQKPRNSPPKPAYDTASAERVEELFRIWLLQRDWCALLDEDPDERNYN